MSLLTTPTFVIGLGGIGNKVIRRLYGRFAAAGMQIPETVRLRSIDTASQEADPTAPPLPASMFTLIDNFDAGAIVQALHGRVEMKRWWRWKPGVYTPGFITYGAEARRPVGRLAFFSQFHRIHDALQRDFQHPLRVEVQDLLANTGDLAQFRHTPRVILVGSVAGGTGAGILIDVAFLVRRLLANLGYQRTTIQALLALPSVIHMQSNDKGTPQAQNRQLNAYAALQELDGLMDHWSPGEMILEYPAPVLRFEPEPPLVNEVYIFTDRKKDGFTFDNQVDVLRRVAHFVFGQIAKGTGKKTLDLMSNVSHVFDPSQRRVADGLKAIYGSFGVEWLETPEKALLKTWTERAAAKIAAAVSDFDFQGTSRKNLKEAALARLDGLFEPYRLAIRVASATADELPTLRGLPSIEVALTQIGGAQNKQALEAALQAFVTQLPSLLEPLKRQTSRLPGLPEEQEKTIAIASEMAASSEWRLGGARRILDEMAVLLDTIATGAPEPAEGLSEILRRCTSLFGKVKPGEAQEWARRLFAARVKNVLKEAAGSRAQRFADHCRRRANDQVKVLQEVLRGAVAELQEEVGAARLESEELWLHSPEAIEEAVALNLESVISASVEDVSADVVKVVRELGERGGSEIRPWAGPALKKALMSALQKNAAKSTKRPPDVAAKIRARVRVCMPLAQLLSHGNEKVAVMGTVHEEFHRFVVSTMTENDVNPMSTATGGPEGADGSFELVPSDDAQRDDVLYMTLGWPLWMFSEVRECQHTAARLAREEPAKADFARALGEFSWLGQNRLEPLSQSEADRLFSFAFVAGLVVPRSGREVTFDGGVFGEQPAADSLDKARERFRLVGLNRQAERWLERERQNPGPFREILRQRIKDLKEALANVGIPASLAEDVGRMVEPVEKEIHDWVVI